jgi:tRNA1(Val) A37 N6-methylase TrmN6
MAANIKIIGKHNTEKIHSFVEKHLPPKSFEKKVFGEVFTPLSLVEEMMTTLTKYADKRFWNNPNIKILDPAAGIGNFPLIAYKKLLIGLKKKIPDEQKRRQHILENMLYMVDLNPTNVKIMKQLFNDKEYKLNIIQGDVLAPTTHEKMKKNWEMTELKFDMVMGNPPFQEVDDNTGKRKALKHNLYTKIFVLSTSFLKNNGYILKILPFSYGTPNHEIFNLLKKYNLLYLNTLVKENYFKDVGSTFSYLLLKKQNPTENIFINNEGLMKIDLSALVCLPKRINVYSLSITQKFFGLNNKLSFEGTSSLHTQNKKKHLSNKINGNFINPVMHSKLTKELKYSDIITNHTQEKIIVSYTNGKEFFYNTGKYGTTQNCLFYNIQKGDNVKKIEFCLNSKLYQYIFTINKLSGFITPELYRNLPLPDGYKKFKTDNDVFKSFNLNSNEINEIYNFTDNKHD